MQKRMGQLVEEGTERVAREVLEEIKKEVSTYGELRDALLRVESDAFYRNDETKLFFIRIVKRIVEEEINTLKIR